MKPIGFPSSDRKNTWNAVLSRLFFSFLLLLGGVLSSEVQAFSLIAQDLESKTEGSSLSIECAGQDDSVINCQSVQIFVRQPDIKRAEESRASALSSIKEALEALSKTCAELPKAKETKEYKNANSLEKEILTRYEALCADKSEKSYRDFVDYIFDREASTCSISSFKNDGMTLYKVNESTWANKPEPTGMCDAITSMILKADPKSKWLLTYKQVRSHVNSESEQCKHFDSNQIVEWSWNVSRTRELGCKYFEFKM